jgi:hypothetical protein
MPIFDHETCTNFAPVDESTIGGMDFVDIMLNLVKVHNFNF